jgi:O-antigen/teichoic acid export membrane protein
MLTDAQAAALPSRGGAATAIAGMTWLFASSVLTRAVTFAGQIVVGWLLVPEDFGIWALAVSISTAVSVLRNGGTSQILIRRAGEYATEAPAIFKYSLAFNVLAMVILAVIAMPLLATSPALAVVLLGVALSIPLGTPAMILKARLTIERRFREVAVIGFWSAFVWQVSAASLACLGLGAMSFALPPLLQALYESFASWRRVRELPTLKSRAAAGSYWTLFRESRWVMLSTAAVALATTGDYFAVAVLTDTRTVGIYFFAFQLVVALGAPIYGAVEVVLPPLLTQLNSQRERQVDACMRAMRTIVTAGVPAAAALALVAPLAVHFVWRGAWDMAIPAVQALAACIPAWLIVNAGRSLIEARGLWRGRFIVMAAYGVGGMGSAAIGTLLGGVTAIAVAVTTFYVCFAVVFLLVLRALGVPVKRSIGSILLPVLVTGLALAASLWLASMWPPGDSALWHDGVALAGFLLIAAVGNLLLFRDVWLQVLGGLVQRLRRREA